MPAPYVTTVVEDQSTRVSANGTVAAGIVIALKKGKVNTPRLISSQTQFLRYCTPNERIEIGWDAAHYEAYEYLKTQGRLYVVRAAADDALYGGCLIKTAESNNDNIGLTVGFSTLDEVVFADDDAVLIYGADQGNYNNDISVIIVTDPEVVKLDGAFILKVYKNKVLVESFVCSLDPALKNGFGVNCFIETVLEGSNYVRALSNALPIDGKFGLPKAQTELLSLVGGDDGSAVTDAERIRALKTLGNINDISLQLIMDGGNTTPTYHKAIDDICVLREDSCHGVLSTPYEDEVNSDALSALKAYRKDKLNLNSFNCELYTPHQKMYDEFNDRYVYVSPSCYVSALIAKYAESLGWHWAVAGYSRGIVNSLDVAKTFEPSEVDELSDNQINTIIKDPGSGNVIFDELTMQSSASDLQDAHISRYINIFLRPALKKALKPFLFEFNDEQTRALVVRMVDTFMQPQKAARAVYNYRIICNEDNNLADDIQNNRLNCWLYLQPTKLAKFITQKIIISPYSVDLESIEI